MFGADGLDEMMGGYELHKKIKWISCKIIPLIVMFQLMEN